MTLHPIPQNFLRYEENFHFFFISVVGYSKIYRRGLNCKEPTHSEVKNQLREGVHEGRHNPRARLAFFYIIKSQNGFLTIVSFKTSFTILGGATTAGPHFLCSYQNKLHPILIQHYE
jgi:hypothetical protein